MTLPLLSSVDVDDIADKLGISSAIWSLFGVVWESSQVLAHLLFEYEIAGKRILEVGCGIGLTSLMLNSRHADITATDYHPEVEPFLQENTLLNKGKVIPFVFLQFHIRIADEQALGSIPRPHQIMTIWPMRCLVYRQYHRHQGIVAYLVKYAGGQSHPFRAYGMGR
jgi:predicted nicotinamide N-methyase